MTANNEPTRRDFLKLTTNALLGLAGLLGLGGLARFLGYQPDPGPPTEFDLGSKYDYPIGSQTIRPDIPTAIQHTREGYIAISLTCTHLGCTVEEDGEGFICPCHGSRYNESGLVLEGPAKEPLRKLRVEIMKDNTLRLFTK